MPLRLSALSRRWNNKDCFSDEALLGKALFDLPVDSPLRKCDRYCSVVTATGLGSAFCKPDSPSPARGIGRLNYLILSAFVLHEMITTATTECCCPISDSN